MDVTAGTPLGPGPPPGLLRAPTAAPRGSGGRRFGSTVQRGDRRDRFSSGAAWQWEVGEAVTGAREVHSALGVLGREPPAPLTPGI